MPVGATKVQIATGFLVMAGYAYPLAGGASALTVAAAAPSLPVSGNTEQVGWLLYTSYLIPFEIASMA